MTGALSAELPSEALLPDDNIRDQCLSLKLHALRLRSVKRIWCWVTRPPKNSQKYKRERNTKETDAYSLTPVLCLLAYHITLPVRSCRMNQVCTVKYVLEPCIHKKG